MRLRGLCYTLMFVRRRELNRLWLLLRSNKLSAPPPLLLRCGLLVWLVAIEEISHRINNIIIIGNDRILYINRGQCPQHKTRTFSTYVCILAAVQHICKVQGHYAVPNYCIPIYINIYVVFFVCILSAYVIYNNLFDRLSIIYRKIF